MTVFPLLVFFSIYEIFLFLPKFRLDSILNFSFFGTIAVISVTLPGIVNLPTFFRHSKSQSDAYLGLNLMIVFTALFQVTTTVIGFDSSSIFIVEDVMYSCLLCFFVLISLFSVNLVNIYFASAGWELIFPHRKTSKEYAVIGLLGTMSYTFLQVSQPMQYLENMASNFIASLGVVLMLAFLVRMVVRHRPRPMEQYVNIGCWLMGAVWGTIVHIQGGLYGAHGIVFSMTVSLISYLCVIFVEETMWALKRAI